MAGRRATRTGGTRGGRTGGTSGGDPATDATGTPAGSADLPGRAAAPGSMELTDPHERARQICLRLLAARPRTRAELEAALGRKGVDGETSRAVLDRLAEVRLVDDEALAESVVHSGHAYQGLGRRALTTQLRRRGVAEPTASAAVAALDGPAEERRARELVRRRLPAVASVDEATAIRRLVGLLARKGYPSGLSYRVVRDELGGAGRDTSLLDEAATDETMTDDTSDPAGGAENG